MSGDMNKHCPVCGARPGERCQTIGWEPGEPIAARWREEPHFYRGNDRPVGTLVPDEPPFAGSEEP
jgi:hypothetical protein